MAHHAAVAVALGQLDGIEGLGERADLVDLDEQGVGRAGLDAACEPLGVGDEQVVADDLHLVAHPVGHRLPAVPVALVERVLDGDQRVGRDEVGVVVDHLGGGLGATLEGVAALVVELGGGDVEREGDLLAGGVAGLLDGLEDQVERGAVARQVRGEAALVAEAGRQALLLEHALERVVDLGAPAQRLAEGLGADRRDHELLDVDVGVGVAAAVEDVHHRHRQHVGVRAADVAEQRQVGGVGGGAGHGERDAEDGVGADLLLVGAAVDGEHLGVDEALLAGVEAEQLGAELVDDGVDGLLRRPCRGSGSCRRHGARRPRRPRSRRRWGPPHARACRRRGRPRPRRWGCRASRGSRGRLRPRWWPRRTPGCWGWGKGSAPSLDLGAGIPPTDPPPGSRSAHPRRRRLRPDPTSRAHSGRSWRPTSRTQAVRMPAARWAWRAAASSATAHGCRRRVLGDDAADELGEVGGRPAEEPLGRRELLGSRRDGEAPQLAQRGAPVVEAVAGEVRGQRRIERGVVVTGVAHRAAEGLGPHLARTPGR